MTAQAGDLQLLDDPVSPENMLDLGLGNMRLRPKFVDTVLQVKIRFPVITGKSLGLVSVPG